MNARFVLYSITLILTYSNASNVKYKVVLIVRPSNTVSIILVYSLDTPIIRPLKFVICFVLLLVNYVLTISYANIVLMIIIISTIIVFRQAYY